MSIVFVADLIINHKFTLGALNCYIFSFILCLMDTNN